MGKSLQGFVFTRGSTAAASSVLAVMLLLAGCADPTAVQKFAQSAPPVAQFEALLLDYPGLETQVPQVESILQRKQVAAPPSTEVTSFCSAIPALVQMHMAMVSYMSALGAAATAGTTLKPASPGGGASNPGKTAAPPEAPSVAQSPCPPTTMPVAVAAQLSTTSAAAPTAAGQALTASALSTDIQKLDKAFPKLGISEADADAASSLVILIQDAATSYLRERAVRKALQQGHDAFLAAVKIENSVIGYLLTHNYASSLQADVSSLSLSAEEPGSQRAGLDTATKLMLAVSPIGPFANPQQVQGIQDSAQAYLTVLDNLQKAYVKLYETSAEGGDVLTPATLKNIQQQLTDLANAYAALSKL